MGRTTIPCALSARVRRYSLAACALFLASAPAAAETTLERIQRTDLVRVGVANEEPYGYVDDTGYLTGESPEIARTVLRRIDPDIRMEAVVADFGDLIPALREGRVDMIAAGMFITSQRCQQVAFTEPTYVIGEAFAVHAGNPKDISDYLSISHNHEARVGLIAGTVEYNYAAVTGIPAERAPLYPDFHDAIDALQAGEVDAVGLTALTAGSLVQEAGDPPLEATEQFFPVLNGKERKGFGAIAFREQDGDLLDRFNRELADFIGSDGHWDTVEPFGFRPDMAPDQSTREICAGQ